MGLSTQKTFWFMAVAGVAGFLWIFHAMLLPFVLAFAVSYFLDPVADRLEARGLGRTSAVAVVLLLFVLLVAAVGVVAVPLAIDQLSQFAMDLPTYIQKLKDAAVPLVQQIQSKFIAGHQDELQKQAANYAGKAFAWGADLLQKVLSGGLAVFDILSLFVVTPIVTFYLLRDWDKVIAKLNIWLPRREAPIIRSLLNEIDVTIASFVRGQSLVCLSLGAYFGIALTIAGVSNGFFIGLMTGTMSFIPYAGLILGFITSLLVTYFQFDGDVVRLIVVSLIFLVGNLMEGNFLTPKLVGEKVGLHPVWILFALMSGGHLMGFTGVMLAVPLAAVIGVLVRFGVARYLTSSFYGSAAMESAETALSHVSVSPPVQQKDKQPAHGGKSRHRSRAHPNKKPGKP